MGALSIASGADDSVFGTYWVQFQPFQVKGELQGCQLNYMTVAADHAYLNGDMVAVNGSIVLRAVDADLALMLKVGLKNISKSSEYKRPTFAYLQTASASTAKAPQKAVDGDPGYKLFVYSATDAVTMRVLEELMTNSNISIGYNRTSNGLDVLVPLDLSVADSELVADQKVRRTKSNQIAAGFSNCAIKVIDQLTSRLK